MITATTNQWHSSAHGKVQIGNLVQRLVQILVSEKGNVKITLSNCQPALLVKTELSAEGRRPNRRV